MLPMTNREIWPDILHGIKEIQAPKDVTLHRQALQLHENTTHWLIDTLNREVKPALTPDVSSYARGRTRCWLEWEGPLSARQDYRPALVVPALWDRLTAIWKESGLKGRPDLGLALHGPVGIRPHRDASYARSTALSINLGKASWGWSPERHSNDAANLRWMDLKGGEVIVFDCKHRHAARSVAPDRWAIIVWQTKPRPRPSRPR